MAHPTDPVLVQILARRMNLNPDEVRALEHGDLSRAFSRHFADDPDIALLMRVEEHRQDAPLHQVLAGHDIALHGRHELASPPAQAYERQRLIHNHRIMQQAHEELRVAQIVVHQVARIFGACPECFGDDDDCRYCDGCGGPGSEAPAKDELLAWVEPALARLGLGVIALRQFQHEYAERDGDDEQDDGAPRQEETDELLQ